MTEINKKDLRISGSTNAKALANSMVEFFMKGYNCIEAVAIGAAAVNQMIKAKIIFKGMITQVGIECSFNESFTKVIKEDTTGIKFIIKII